VEPSVEERGTALNSSASTLHPGAVPTFKFDVKRVREKPLLDVAFHAAQDASSWQRNREEIVIRTRNVGAGRRRARPRDQGCSITRNVDGSSRRTVASNLVGIVNVKTVQLQSRTAGNGDTASEVG